MNAPETDRNRWGKAKAGLSTLMADRHPLAAIVMAVRFYSRLYAGPQAHEAPSLARMAPLLPVAGLYIGLVPIAALGLLILLGFPPLFAGFFAVGLFAAATGAMAEDALGDSADGLVGGTTRARRLEIFKDSRLGTYGVLAIVVFSGLRATALAGLAAAGPLPAMGLWLAAMLVARSFSLWLPHALPPARAEGASASVGQLAAPAFWQGAGLAAALGAVAALPFIGWQAYLATLLGLLALIWAWGRLCERLVGGQTGDTIGAGQALLEIAALSAFIGFFGH